MFNPITLVGLAIVLGVCFLVGLIYKIPTTEPYSVSITGETTKAVYENFFSSTDTTYDNRANINKKLGETYSYLVAQSYSNENVEELQQINSLAKQVTDNKITQELTKYNNNPALCTYYENNDLTVFNNLLSDIKSFVIEFDKLDQFQTRLVLKDKDFAKLESIATTLEEILLPSKTITEQLDELYTNKEIFSSIVEISQNAKLIKFDNSTLETFKNDYYEKARAKCTSILEEMKNLYDNTLSNYDTSNREKMISYIKKYKIVCESSNTAILSEFKIILHGLSSDYKDIHNYGNIKLEEEKENLVVAKYYINSDELSFVQYQQPLNFGSASSKVTAYDHSYFIISIVGFLTILFGIFCAYKLYGKDRKNGKLDILLAQKVTFNQVFAGKFLAIIFSTLFCLASFTLLSFVWGSILYSFLPNSIFAIFNLQTAYTISPFLFLLIKIAGIELQVIFWVIVTIFAMNVSRRFTISYAITLLIFAISTVCNIFLNGQIWYCLLPFIHTDLTSFLGGATMQTGFLVTSLYSYGSFYISLAYYLVVIALLYNFTKQLFKKN